MSSLHDRVRGIQDRILSEIEARLDALERRRQPGAGHVTHGGEPLDAEARLAALARAAAGLEPLSGDID